MSGFTPGPWEISESAYVCRQAIVARTPEGDLDPIAEVMGSGKGQNLANARLIAAAPEMLAALRELIPWAVGPHMRKPEGCAAVKAALAAIAKAEGR